MYLSDGASRGFNCAEFEAESHLSGHSLWSLWFTNGCKTIVQEGIGYPEATSAKHGRSSTEFSGLHWGKRFHLFQSARSSPTWEATSPVDFFSVLIIFELAQLMFFSPKFFLSPERQGTTQLPILWSLMIVPVPPFYLCTFRVQLLPLGWSIFTASNWPCCYFLGFIVVQIVWLDCVLSHGGCMNMGPHGTF